MTHFRLDEKIALITGASRGIGKAIAETFARQGATVLLNYVKGESEAKAVADAIKEKGGKAFLAPFNVADAAETENAIEALIKEHGTLDVFVANAGVAVDGLLLRQKEEDLDRMFAVNVKGAVFAARAAMKPMMRKKEGRVIFLSSVVGEAGNVGQTGYSITKAALLGATKSIAKEYAGKQITVNAIAPGLIATQMTEGMSDEMKKVALSHIPLGREGTPEDVAYAALFLASKEAAYITGQVLRVNGGMYQ